MRPLRLGIAGCGRIAERGYLAAAHGSPAVELVAVADPDLDRAGNLARELGGVPAFASAGELVAADGIEALLVAAPAEHHVEIATLASQAGAATLVEKPPAPDLAGATRLAALEPVPAIGFNRRFLQGAALVDAIPARCWLEIELELRYRRDAWKSHEARDDALLDAGVHLIDLAAFLSGSAPIAVRDARLAPERAELEVELGRARARISCATDRRHLERVEVRDRSGRRLAASRLGGVRGRLTALRGAPHPVTLSLQRQLAALAATLRGDPDPSLATAMDGLAAMAAVEAARRSAALAGAEVVVEPGRLG